MTNPTTSIRWPLAQQVATLVDAHANCSTITVFPFWPGDKDQRAEFGVIEDLKSSDIAVANWQSGRKQRNETVTMTVKFYVSGKRTADALMDRLNELAAAVEDVFADDLSLATAGVVKAEVTAVELDPFETADVMFVGTAAVSCSILTRLH